MEIDVVAESDDESSILLGEAGWSGTDDAGARLGALRRKAEAFPLRAGRRVHLALFLSGPVRVRGARVFTPRHVLSALR
jgi:hypothetical protein